MTMPTNLTQLVWVEGLPGVGKPFLIWCLTNIVRNINKRNSVDLAMVPTGCAASHMEGGTKIRSLVNHIKYYV